MNFFFQLILMCCFTFLINIDLSNAQQDSTFLESPYIYELENKHYQAWRDIYDEWQQREYQKLLLDHKLRMNCKNCTGIFVDVELSVDSSGELKNPVIISGRLCEKRIPVKFAKEIINSLPQQHYPTELRSKRFRTRLGTLLKC